MQAYKDWSRKYAGYENCVSCAVRVTPFFDTPQGARAWLNGRYEDCYIRPVANWEEVLNNRNDNNTDEGVPLGQ